MATCVPAWWGKAPSACKSSLVDSCWVLLGAVVLGAVMVVFLVLFEYFKKVPYPFLSFKHPSGAASLTVSRVYRDFHGQLSNDSWAII